MARARRRRSASTISGSSSERRTRSLSPDGAQAVCTLQSFSMEREQGRRPRCGCFHLRRRAAPPDECGEKDGQPAWSPTGERIAFPRREQHGARDEAQQLYVIAPDGGEARRISDSAPGINRSSGCPTASASPFVAWVWPSCAARRRRPGFKEFKERKESAYVTSEAQYRYGTTAADGPGAHLHLLDVATSGRIVDLFEGTDWSPARRAGRTASTSRPTAAASSSPTTPAPRSAWTTAALSAEIDLRTRRVATVCAKRQAWDMSAPRCSPDGGRIAFLGSPGPAHACRTSSVGNAAGAGRWRAPPGPFAARPAALGRRRPGPCFAAEHEARNPPGASTCTERAPATRIFPAAGCRASTSSNGVVAVAAAMDHPARVHALRDGEPPRRLERFNDDLLATLKARRARGCAAPGAQGDEGADVAGLSARLRPAKRNTPCCTASTAARTRPAATHLPLPLEQNCSRRTTTWTPVRQLPRLFERFRLTSSTASRTAGASSSCRTWRRHRLDAHNPWVDGQRILPPAARRLHGRVDERPREAITVPTSLPRRLLRPFRCSPRTSPGSRANRELLGRHGVHAQSPHAFAGG